MSDGAMAFDARGGFAIGTPMRRGNCLGNFGVTFLAGLFGDCQIPRFNLNGFVKIVEGEIERMPKAVRSFRRILGNGSCWRMAIIASGGATVRRFQPPRILFIHDVAVRT